MFLNIWGRKQVAGGKNSIAEEKRREGKKMYVSFCLIMNKETTDSGHVGEIGMRNGCLRYRNKKELSFNVF